MINGIRYLSGQFGENLWKKKMEQPALKLV